MNSNLRSLTTSVKGNKLPTSGSEVADGYRRLSVLVGTCIMDLESEYWKAEHMNASDLGKIILHLLAFL